MSPKERYEEVDAESRSRARLVAGLAGMGIFYVAMQVLSPTDARADAPGGIPAAEASHDHGHGNGDESPRHNPYDKPTNDPTPTAASIPDSAPIEAEVVLQLEEAPVLPGQSVESTQSEEPPQAGTPSNASVETSPMPDATEPTVTPDPQASTSSSSPSPNNPADQPAQSTPKIAPVTPLPTPARDPVQTPPASQTAPAPSAENSPSPRSDAPTHPVLPDAAPIESEVAVVLQPHDPAVPASPANGGRPTPKPNPSSSQSGAGAPDPEIVDFNQHEAPWAGHEYHGEGGSGNIDHNGCGPTTIARVFSNALDREITPVEIADRLMAHGAAGVTTDGSTMHNGIAILAEEYGLRYEWFSNIHIWDDLVSTVNSGKTVILNGREDYDDPTTPATSGGHIFAIRAITSEGVDIIDPNRQDLDDGLVSPESIMTHIPMDNGFGIAIWNPQATPSVPADPESQPATETDADSLLPTAEIPDAAPIESGVSELLAPALPDAEPILQDESVVSILTPINADQPESQVPEAAPQTPNYTQADYIKAAEELVGRSGEWSNRGIAMKFYIEHGFSPVQAAALIGNFIAESGLDPSRHQVDGPAIGMAQWEGGRQKQLLYMADLAGLPWDDFGYQLEYSWWEMNNNPADIRAREKLLAAKTPEEAALAVRIYYERPSAHRDQERIDATNLVLGGFYEELRD